MPTSNPDQIGEILKLIIQFQPSSILDIGIGFGKWGVLCREYLDIWHGYVQKDDWKIKIDGIEICGEYDNPIWDIYDNIILGDVMEYFPHLNEYDVILAIDVLEHLSREDGLKIINSLGKHYIITTPLLFQSYTLAVPLNERHKSIYFVDDFHNHKIIENQIIAWQ